MSPECIFQKTHPQCENEINVIILPKINAKTLQQDDAQKNDFYGGNRINLRRKRVKNSISDVLFGS